MQSIAQSMQGIQGGPNAQQNMALSAMGMGEAHLGMHGHMMMSA